MDDLRKDLILFHNKEPDVIVYYNPKWMKTKWKVNAELANVIHLLFGGVFRVSN